MTRPNVLLAFSVFSLSAQTLDLYPEVRALIREAESESSNIRLLEDRSNPHTWAGRIYARAGYLDDAERVFSEFPEVPSVPPYALWRAWVVYGHLDRAEKVVTSIADPERKATYLSALADILWRMGQSTEARIRFKAAREFANEVVDATRRKQILVSIDQGLMFVADPPPELISIVPNPRPRVRHEDSPIPLFPITADGFENTATKRSGAQAGANAEFLKKLYDRVAVRDRDGVQKLTEEAATAFQKTLGIASMEHLLILTYQPELAEAFARSIPESDSSCLIAKAEALSAAGSAWFRALNDNRAQIAFRAAIQIAQKVSNPTLGKLSVLNSIAAAQRGARFVKDSDQTFRSAMVLAQELPERPKFRPGALRQMDTNIQYRDEAFEKILLVAIRVGAMETAQEVTAILKTTGDTGATIVDAWINTDHPQEAIAAARLIQNRKSRVSALLSLAQTLLDTAGAPVF